MAEAIRCYDGNFIEIGNYDSQVQIIFITLSYVFIQK